MEMMNNANIVFRWFRNN